MNARNCNNSDLEIYDILQASVWSPVTFGGFWPVEKKQMLFLAQDISSHMILYDDTTLQGLAGIACRLCKGKRRGMECE